MNVTAGSSRRSSRRIMVGGVAIGAGAPVTIQSMTTTDTRDVAATVRQIRRLQRVGCEIIRVAVPDRAAAESLSGIKKRISLPLVADIHFDYRLALLAIENGVDKIRINPGNMRRPEHIVTVLRAAAAKRIPIRIGLNSGSVARRPGRALADDMVDTALEYMRFFEQQGFVDSIISLKAPDVRATVNAYHRLASLSDVPLHIGITAAGSDMDAVVKSSIGVGALLLDGIGDTVRISLTADPAEEIKVARVILQEVQLRHGGIEIISCPTCGRTSVDLVRLTRQVKKILAPLQSGFRQRRLRVAIMGCAVNGPGEARDADIGLAWGAQTAVLFRRGQVVRTVRQDDCLTSIYDEVRDEMVRVDAADAQGNSG